MRWQYRTIVFEYQKDGLLGEKYIDDEVVEATLNEQGDDHWEVIGITMTHEGLLAVLKRPRSEETSPRKASPADRQGHAETPAIRLTNPPREPRVQQLPSGRQPQNQNPPQDPLDTIKIS